MIINKTNVENLPATEKGDLAFYFDDGIKGFGVRVSGSTKTYIVQKYIDKKKVRIKLGRHGEISAETARKKAQAFIGQVAAGINPVAEQERKETDQLTLTDILNEYIIARQADGGLRPTTISLYRGALRRCFSDWADKPVVNITQSMVVERFEKIATTEGERSNKGGAKAMASQSMRILNSLLTFAAVKYEGAGIESAPTKKLSQLHRKWSKTARRSDVINPGDMKPWYDAVLRLPNETMRDYILFCFFTGLRRSAASKVKWSNFNKRSKLLIIPQDDDKTGQERRLPLPEFVCQILDRRSKLPRQIDNDYIFPSEQESTVRRKGEAQPKYIQEPKRAIARIIKNSQVKFSMHTLRRTFATTANRLDIAHYKLKALIGHSVQDDVTGGYVQVDPEQLREPMQKICDYLREECGAQEAFTTQIEQALA